MPVPGKPTAACFVEGLNFQGIYTQVDRQDRRAIRIPARSRSKKFMHVQRADDLKE
jgi:hypothetical protein